jgi:hypothetical protein
MDEGARPELDRLLVDIDPAIPSEVDVQLLLPARDLPVPVRRSVRGSSKIWQPNAVMPRSVRASLITPPMRVVISSIVLRT